MNLDQALRALGLMTDTVSQMQDFIHELRRQLGEAQGNACTCEASEAEDAAGE